MKAEEQAVKRTCDDKLADNAEAKKGKGAGMIKMAKIDENAFHRMGRFPAGHEVVKKQKKELRRGGPGSLLIRPKPGQSGRYETLGSYVWLLAAKELGWKDIPATNVVAFDDDQSLSWTMAQTILADSRPACLIEAVRLTKMFLEKWVGESATWDELSSEVRRIFITELQFYRCKDRGVGAFEIGVFLEHDSIDMADIETAIQSLEDAEVGLVDLDAVTALPSMADARKFLNAVKWFHHPLEGQLYLARQIRDEGVDTEEVFEWRSYTFQSREEAT